MAGFLDDLPDLDLPRPPRRTPRSAPEIDCVSWRRPRCPRCDSADCPVVDSHSAPVRWHECRNPDCPGRTAGGGFRFKSIESNYRPSEG